MLASLEVYFSSSIKRTVSGQSIKNQAFSEAPFSYRDSNDLIFFQKADELRGITKGIFSLVLFGYLLLNVFVVTVFLKMNKNLHILEIIVYWLLSSYVFQNFSAICYMNFKTMIIPENLTSEYTHVLNRLVLFPILMVSFLHFFSVSRTYFKKAAILICYIVLLTGLEWVADSTNVLVHVHWRLWWSFAYWLVALLVLLGFMKWFRTLLFKGRINL